MKTVIITGASGFIGSAVKSIFKGHYNSNYKFIYLGSGNGKYDLRDGMKVAAMYDELEPDCILHMAATCGGILANKQNPAKYLYDNMQMGLNIFEIAKDRGVKEIYTIGSVCSYPKFCPTPFKEEDIWNGYPEETNAPYGFAKRGLLMLQNTYRAQYGIRGAHLILANSYGMFDNFDPITSHVIPALIRKFSNAKFNKEDIVHCWGSGNSTREFLFSLDAAEALYRAITMGIDEELPINIGNGVEISISDLANKIAALHEFKGEIKYNGDDLDGQPSRCLNVNRMKALLNYYPETKLDDGLRMVIDWYDDDRWYHFDRNTGKYV